MLNSIIKSSLLGGITLFVWGAVSWMALPWHNATLLKFQNEEAVAAVIRSEASQPGVYILPNAHHREAGMSDEAFTAMSEEAMRRYATGPIVFAAVSLAGSTGMGNQLFISFVIQTLSALCVTLLVLRTGVTGYWPRLRIILLFALAASTYLLLPLWNWWGFSTPYTFVSLADTLIGWGLAGSVIAKVA